MSKSYKKAIVKESARGTNKRRKTMANAKVRAYLKEDLRLAIEDPENYSTPRKTKQIYETWDICDYRINYEYRINDDECKEKYSRK